jgi:hypothetical protein
MIQVTSSMTVYAVILFHIWFKVVHIPSVPQAFPQLFQFNFYVISSVYDGRLVLLQLADIHVAKRRWIVNLHDIAGIIGRLLLTTHEVFLFLVVIDRVNIDDPLEAGWLFIPADIHTSFIYHTLWLSIGLLHWGGVNVS